MGSITRTIRYYGLIQIPDEAKKARRFTVTFDIIRPALSQYLNAKYNPSQTFHGYAVFRDDIRVVRSKPIQWDNVIIDEFRNDALFIHQSISCSLNAVLTSFVNLETALNLVPFEKINPIEDWKNLFPDYDSIAVKLLTETMVGQLVLTWDDAEKCSVQDSKDPKFKAPPNPPPPVPKPANDPDENLPPISPPYDGGDDDGFTYKPDKPDDNIGERCQQLTLTYSFEIDANGYGNYNTISNQVIHIFGEFGGLSIIRKPDGSPDIAVKCHGVIDYNQQCSDEEQTIGIGGFSGLPATAQMRNPVVISVV